MMKTRAVPFSTNFWINLVSINSVRGISVKQQNSLDKGCEEIFCNSLCLENVGTNKPTCDEKNIISSCVRSVEPNNIKGYPILTEKLKWWSRTVFKHFSSPVLPLNFSKWRRLFGEHSRYFAAMFHTCEESVRPRNGPRVSHAWF